MDSFIARPDKERRDILIEAANQRGVSNIIMEKDFWVCWTLRQLYALPELAPYLTFKGGTSLSKAYGLIERFSEDIDLTISHDAPFITEGAEPMQDDISGKERERRIDTLKENAQRFVSDIALAALERTFAQSLKEDWRIVLDEEDDDKQTLLFFYPRIFDFKGSRKVTGSPESYIRPAVKLEFGARGEPVPHETKIIRPYVAEVLPDLFKDGAVSVTVLSAERTFWEKATILHGLYHGMKSNDRVSRHYYDTYVMAEKGVADQALEKPALLEQVVKNKMRMFRDTKASYDTAKPGSLRLVPTDEMIPGLKKDYQAMREMFMGGIPNFEDILILLKQLEDKINNPRKSHGGSFIIARRRRR